MSYRVVQGIGRSMVNASHRVDFERCELDASLTARFEKQVDRHADRIAISERDQKITYRELDIATNRLAHRLIAACGSGSARVGLLFETSASAVIGHLGALKAGKTCVALDPSFPIKRLQQIAEDADVDAIVTTQDFAAIAARLDAPLILDIDEDSAALTTRPVVAVSADSLAAIVYTSGSTGRPKGVMQTHRVLLHRVWSDTHYGEITYEDRQSMLLSLTFGAGFPDVLGAVLNGAALYPFNLKKHDLYQLADWLAASRITIFTPPIAAFRQFSRLCPPDRRFPDCRIVNLAGEAAYDAELESFERLFDSSRCRLINILAATEAQIMCRYSVNASVQPERVLPVGYVEADKQHRIVNADGNDVPVGESGELLIRSRYLSPGYWRRPEMTRAAFQSHSDGTISYRTRDLVLARADGCLEHRGRIDSVIKLRGYRIEVVEVEAALVGSAGIRAAAVAARELESANSQLVAFVVPDDEADVSANELREAVGLKLPDYMIPARIVVLDDLPRTTNGKIDRAALKDVPLPAGPVAMESGDRAGDDASASHLTGEIERRIIEIWQDILRVDSIGIDDNFFELGGDSLSMVSLATELRLAIGREIPVQTLLSAPTIRQLVTAIQDGDAPVSTVALAPPSRLALERRPVFCVLGLYLYKHLANALGPEVMTYGIFLESEIAVLRPENLAGHRYLTARAPQLQLPSCESLATAYIEEIRRVQGRGPYHLVGSSYGGVVAFEIARQLKALGEEVRLLAMLDSFAPGFRRPVTPRGWANHCRQWAQRFLPRRMPGPGSSKEAWDRLRSQAREEALRNYRPAPLAADAILFKAAQPIPFPGYAVDATLGWERWIEGELTTQKIPGDHLGILAPPNVALLAAKIRQRLDRTPWGTVVAEEGVDETLSPAPEVRANRSRRNVPLRYTRPVRGSGWQKSRNRARS